MYGRWVKIDGRWTKQSVQPADEVQTLVDHNHYIRHHLADKPGGAGSKNTRWVARISTVLRAKLVHEWRMKGGRRATGFKADEYVLMKISTGEFEDFIVTPSGKTGFESVARKSTFGSNPRQKPKLTRPVSTNTRVHWVKKAQPIQ